MADVFGDILPLAVGVVISPIPIIATILMLLAPRAGATSMGFLIGWVLGIAAATTVFTVVSASVGLTATSDSSTSTDWIKVALGILLLVLAGRQWRSRPKSGAEASLPAWMSAVDTFAFGKAAGLGFLLSAVNPKNLLLCAAAGTEIGGSALSNGSRAVLVLVFTVIAACSVAIPVIGYAVAKERMRQPLGELKTWLQQHNAAVMSVLLLVIGVVLIGKGIGGP